MEESEKSRLKIELMGQMKEELKRQVEAEVEEEVDEELQKKSSYFSTLGQFKGYLFAVAATIMALGQFSEAVSLIQDGVDSLRSHFTNTVEYELLDQIHVGNTEDYVEGLLGFPQVSRAIDQQVVANYFFNDKFLLTIFIEDHRVAAYTVIPLLDDFRPVVISSADISWTLLDQSYENFPANPKLYMVDHSKTISYYLESLDNGNAGLFVQTYLGSVAIGPQSGDEFLIDLYNKEVSGSDEQILERQDRLRQMVHPNLYGMGLLPLESVRKSLLTGAEFSSYFGS